MKPDVQSQLTCDVASEFQMESQPLEADRILTDRSETWTPQDWLLAVGLTALLLLGALACLAMTPGVVLR